MPLSLDNITSRHGAALGLLLGVAACASHEAQPPAAPRDSRPHPIAAPATGVHQVAEDRDRAPDPVAPAQTPGDEPQTSRPPQGETAPRKAARTSTGDAMLDELRRLATEAPIRELRSRMPWWFVMRARDYIQDPVLWQGIDRMSEEVATNPDHGFHELDVAVVIQCIEHDKRPEGRALKPRLPALRAARQSARAKARAQGSK